MTERSIAFSAPMIRAILAGAKTQTRRPVKPQPPATSFGVDWYTPTRVDRRGEEVPAERDVFGMYDLDGEWGRPCPYGSPGDTLWVREHLRRKPLPNLLTGEPTNAQCVSYAADGDFARNPDGFDYAWPWRASSLPARYCPRRASRLTLAVESVRVQRVQDVSGADITAEGVTAEGVSMLWVGATRARRAECGYVQALKGHLDAYRWDTLTPRSLWRIGWTLIYGRESWDANPWVWAVTFRVVP